MTIRANGVPVLPAPRDCDLPPTRIGHPGPPRQQRCVTRQTARESRRLSMRDNVGRIARAIMLAGGITAAVALPAIAGTPLLPSSADASAKTALAAPAF